MSPNPEPAREVVEVKLREQLNESAVLIVELLAIIRFGNPGFAGDIHIRRARRVIDGHPEAIAAGEANYRAWCAADPDHAPDGTRESLATCAHMLEEYGPECLPANASGHVDFVRAMTDATAASIRAFLAAAPPTPSGYDLEQRAREMLAVASDGQSFVQRKLREDNYRQHNIMIPATIALRAIESALKGQPAASGREAERSILIAREEEARGVIEPFAQAAELLIDGEHADNEGLLDCYLAGRAVTAGDLRAARAYLTKETR